MSFQKKPWKNIAPTPAERDVFEALCSLGPSPIHAIRKHLFSTKHRKMKQKPAYSTVLAAMQSLRKKKWVGVSDRQGNVYVYAASADMEALEGALIIDFVGRHSMKAPRILINLFLKSIAQHPELKEHAKHLEELLKAVKSRK